MKPSLARATMLPELTIFGSSVSGSERALRSSSWRGKPWRLLAPRRWWLLKARYGSMDKLLFWLGIGAAQKGAGSKEVKPSRHPVIAFVVGILIAVLIAAGAFVLLVSQR